MAAEFSFRQAWRTSAHSSAVYDVLADVERYPQWWPQVRAVAKLDEHSGVAVCRSLAPFDLELVLTSEVEDADGGLLRVGLAGDLSGWAGFRLADAGPGTAVEFREEVTVERPLLRRLAAALGPALAVNHAWMMRGCRLGLARRLR